jgi:hypothetical protein
MMYPFVTDPARAVTTVIPIDLVAGKAGKPVTVGCTHLHTATTTGPLTLHGDRVASGSEEDDMPSTLIPTCSSCGLRFENRPLLELHLRENHPLHRPAAEPGRPVDSGTKAGTIIVTSPRRPRRPHSEWAMTGLRRVTGAFRHANAELLLASELLLRPGGQPRPSQPAGPHAEAGAHQPSASMRTDRAA